MMIMSFPIGAYVVFNTNVGDEINFEYPLDSLNLFAAGISFQIPFDFVLGDVFVLVWSFYAVLFGVAILGPYNGFLKSLTQTLSFGKINTNSNYMFAIITWFSILVVVSGIINFIQEGFDVVIVAPEIENNLIQFYTVTLAPITEEIGFRVFLIGLPLFAIYSYKSSWRYFFKSLWHPDRHLHVYDKRKVISLVVAVAIFFGIAHVIMGDPWSNGKFLQASASGIILGWVYFRFGLISAILIHWASNYFVYSYANLISQVNEIAIQEAFAHSLFGTMELILVAAGVLSILILLIQRFYSKQKQLEA
ncbi:MAG: CPBP family intramembrane metalloprotease [Nitrosopumilaceae archaeon]|nr:CPBP family intramembrane metalloprotease [Nitrosopumilaceae archaeon]NIU01422.1 CPBP family intramembrane metalloprotease [Nitrosopumilaceae archaeon]NIU87841.1 CPBP family intramembrane metalloprotease [Nitrosopumilaceae archaeon]NIV65981.1 CPBP family intramembrane metalloprotease [Nitrosopumilaceae archaeon]NIX62024.1 CPBP family intramembrane metalloprotease [Nitrosopumilaceae archaeon]